ncbi:LAFE_0C06700g1_1 [Lachancea fermentati]|uniref:LAFE_0C06700g1_1 n=1 Tax=Lachancea fermentati TaxID=4955 RepID=A0A1G4M9Q3_LACFM|nr:LAFE_0C06700g1_1 [Lachancea fermentati]
MSGIQEDISKNLKLIIAEKLRALQNFNEDVNYVAEYIVLLMSNGGTIESVVQELTSLFDSVAPSAFQNVVQDAFTALNYLQNGENLESVVSKLGGAQSAFPGAAVETMTPAPVQTTPTPMNMVASAPEAPRSAFEGIVDVTSAPRTGGVGKRGGHQRGGINKSGGRGNRENGERGGRSNGKYNNNALAMALGMDPSASNVNVVQKKQGRCKLFPRCPLGRQCPHAHPTQACREYPNCPNPPGTCNYLHPNEDVELMKEIEKTREEFREKRAAIAASKAKPINTGIVLCKFGCLCSNPQCPFGHPTPANEDAKVITFVWCPENLNCTNPQCDKAHSSLSKIKDVTPLSVRKPARPTVEKSLVQCKFGQHCTNKRCKFRHARSHIMCRDGANCTRIDCLFGHPIDEDCKFGTECKNVYCLFRHPEGRQLPEKPQGNSNTWVNPNMGTGNSISNERPFAVPESQVLESAPTQDGDAMMN